MSSDRVMKSVLRNVLHSYTGRASEYHGYWLFGFLVAEIEQVDIDLLASSDNRLDTPLAVAARLAAATFKGQMLKARLPLSQVAMARLLICKLPGAISAFAGDFERVGLNVGFLASAVMRSGRRFEHRLQIFVAPHDPGRERRSNRAEPT